MVVVVVRAAAAAAATEVRVVWGETEAEAEEAEVHALAQSAELLAIASEMVEYRGLHAEYASRYEDARVPTQRKGRRWSEVVGCERVAAVLERLNVSRIAVGHTPADSVRVRCGGRLLAVDSTLSRSFRAHGNFYCSEAMTAADPTVCPPINQACEGQIVRLERSGDGSPWMLHVVESKKKESESNVERDEGAVDERVEL